MTMRTDPMAIGAITPAAGLTTQLPTVRKRKKVPIISAINFFIDSLGDGLASPREACEQHFSDSASGGASQRIGQGKLPVVERLADDDPFDLPSQRAERCDMIEARHAARRGDVHPRYGD